MRSMKRIVTSLSVLCSLCVSAIALGAPVLYPGPTIIDDTGTRRTPTSISVASVTDMDGNAIASPGAVAHFAGSNSGVVYDAAAKGEAWITLTPVLAGSTFASTPPVIFCSADPQTLVAANTTAASTNKAIVLATGVVGASPTTTVIPTNLSTTAGDIYSGDEVTWLTGPNAGKASHVLSWSATGSTLTLAAALPNAPTAGDTFSLSPYGKGLTNLVTNLGTDGKVILSSNTQPSIVASSVTTPVALAGTQSFNNTGQTLPIPANATQWAGATISTGVPLAASAYTVPLTAAQYASAPAWWLPPPTDYQQRAVPVTLPTTPPTGYGGSSADTPGTTTLLARLPVTPPTAAQIVAAIDADVLEAGGLTRKQEEALAASTDHHAYRSNKNLLTGVVTTRYYNVTTDGSIGSTLYATEVFTPQIGTTDATRVWTYTSALTTL
ncbi:hypothetical protein CCAX7_000260 [Capsulimonas corticalis]|uniref:Uncharacterized protein n=1 Tax=Capsulimonas corticalis TaxID=2219043 RepID=A0A402CRK6_9BACT|nr:phage BR0599 family protein [Capsulimonas corticalis]BDI27975.1 hypothetical protein CCAX7_000260 [Capsulimonas corticalis]